MKTLFRLLCSLVLFVSIDALAETHEGAPVSLELGEQRMLILKDLKRFSISGDSIHYVRIPNDDALLLKAVKPGLCTLFVGKTNAESETRLIRVTAAKTLPYPPALYQALNHLKQTEAIEHGGHFILRGAVRNREEGAEIAYLKQQFPNLIIDETSLDSATLAQSKNELQKLVAPYPDLHLEVVEDSLFIHGALPSGVQKEAFIKKVKQIQALTHLEIQSIQSSDPTLYFKVFLLEVKKDALTQLGVSWPSSQAASLSLRGPFFSVGESLELSIQAFTQKGVMRVLSSPELVVKVPGQAELFTGRELPIREQNKFMNSVVWKNIGLSLRLDVKEYSGDRVRLTVETEISHLDELAKNDNIPGVQSNRMKTLVDGTIGKPLLLSGLLEEELHEKTSGIRGLSSIPILGSLFSSEDYQNHRSEFVAILLPYRNLPLHPLERISKEYPKGFLPLPRHSFSSEEREKLKARADYPWSAL